MFNWVFVVAPWTMDTSGTGEAACDKDQVAGFAFADDEPAYPQVVVAILDDVIEKNQGQNRQNHQREDQHGLVYVKDC